MEPFFISIILIFFMPFFLYQLHLQVKKFLLCQTYSKQALDTLNLKSEDKKKKQGIEGK